MLFDASPKTVRELFLIGKLVVPRFQRPYSWEKDQVGVLAEDLKYAFENDGEYFLGTTVLTRQHDFFEVIDGQQRLTTLLIFFAAFRDHLNSSPDNAHREFARGIQDAYLLSLNPVISKKEGLVLGPKDNEVFQRAILGGDLVWRDPKIKSSGRPKRVPIQIAYNILTDFLREHFPVSGNKSGLKAIESFFKFISDKCRLIVVTVESEAAAYSVFETINARGLDLTAADLIKNRVFAAGETLKAREKIETLWSDISDEVEAEDSKALSRFLKTFWLSRFGNVTQKQLFAEFADKIELASESIRKLEEFLRELKDAAEELSEIRNLRVGSEDGDVIQGLSRLGVVQPLPLLLAAKIKKLPKEDFHRLVLLIDCLTVRDTIVGYQTANKLEKRYSAWALEIRSNGKSGISTIKKEIFKDFLDDDQFEEAFKKLEVGSVASRYILLRIEHSLNKEKSLNMDQVDLEHICPENLSKGWDKELEDYNGLIGNMTLVHYKLNRSMKNEPFKDKLKRYKKSEVLLTKKLDAMTSWTKQDILDRQKYLWGQAIKIWDYKRIF